MKTCTQCGKTAPLAEFGRNVKSRDGHRAECKKCMAARQRRLYKPSARIGQVVDSTCAHCGIDFSYRRRSGTDRMYCGDLCRYKAGEVKKLARGLAVVRRCDCGSTEVARVGKAVCPPCKKDRRDPEKARLRERQRTLRKYGLTESDWDGLIVRQKGRCAICRTDRPGGKGERWHIDHCHATNVVRGLLCHSCNTSLGHFRDDPQLLINAMKYLGVVTDGFTWQQLGIPEAG